MAHGGIRFAIAGVLSLLLLGHSPTAAGNDEAWTRGASLYEKHCHQCPKPVFTFESAAWCTVTLTYGTKSNVGARCLTYPGRRPTKSRSSAN